MPQKATVDKLLAESFKELVVITPVEKITIKDVAQLADVSIATVSRVIHGQDNVSPVYVQRVHDAMRQLNWRPNQAAQSLRSTKSRTIGVILPNTIDPFFGSIAALVLYMFGTGTIRGFALTLGISVVTSMFTAVFVTHKLLDIFADLGVKNQKLYVR